MPAGQLFACAFFIVLFFAAITSAVSMLEVCVAAVDEVTGWTRRKTSLVLTCILLLISLLPALSYSSLRLPVFEVPLLDVMDETVGIYGLQIAAFLLAVTFTSFLPSEVFFRELGEATVRNRILSFLCKYVIPAALLLTIGVQLWIGIDISGICGVSGT